MSDDAEKPSGPEEKIIIQHKRAYNFSSNFASGAIVTGPTPDGMYHMIFYADAIGITQETGSFSSSDELKTTYKTTVDQSALDVHREDKARISISRNTMKNIHSALQRMLESESEIEDARPKT